MALVQSVWAKARELLGRLGVGPRLEEKPPNPVVLCTMRRRLTPGELES